MPCPYADVLGVPGQGFHAQRIGGYALMIFYGTIGLAMLTAYLTKTSFLISLGGWFIGGEVLHYMFGTQTALMRDLGISPCHEP